jgi:hypothetical protein
MLVWKPQCNIEGLEESYVCIALFWRSWTSDAILVVLVLLLHGIDRYSGVFFL